MPYRMVKDTQACPASKPYAVRNTDTGQVVGCHPTEEKAKRHMMALYANVRDARG